MQKSVMSLDPSAPNLQSTSQNLPSSQKTHIEFLRIIASFLVIVNHTNSDIFLSNAPSVTWFCSITWFFLCKVAVPIFLMIMGALLLEKHDPPKKSLQRILRILIVFFAASACYYVFYRRANPASIHILEFLKLFLAGKNITTAYWYLYLYLSLLCILPLLQKMAVACSARDIQLLLSLSLGVLGTFPLFAILTPYTLNFFQKDGLFSPYIGMVFAGYYIERHMVITRRKSYIAGLIFFLLILFQVTATHRLYWIDPTSYGALDNRTLVTITGGSACVYIMAKYFFSVVSLSGRVQQIICRFGSLTFGIYLLSDMMLQILKPLLVFLNGKLQVFLAMLVWEVCIFLSCAAVTAALRMIPALRKWL